MGMKVGDLITMSKGWMNSKYENAVGVVIYPANTCHSFIGFKVGVLWSYSTRVDWVPYEWVELRSESR